MGPHFPVYAIVTLLIPRITINQSRTYRIPSSTAYPLASVILLPGRSTLFLPTHAVCADMASRPLFCLPSAVAGWSWTRFASVDITTISLDCPSPLFIAASHHIAMPRPLSSAFLGTPSSQLVLPANVKSPSVTSCDKVASSLSGGHLFPVLFWEFVMSSGQEGSLIFLGLADRTRTSRK
ncbi:hypothetical protein BV22DRAFT_1033982 [Leucogyrophana mollusca]|uniref:Uncharacterized protein n=1 Tax=Leucogyrophana mollusca TaxID=85980 RepID=A0ACB8BI94_9AGAM|nr:hypothetical protein BV22DRAFT_1033982 [Leucogyrophana mollusca]